MTSSSNVRIPTPNSSRYLQQLCRHWRHDLAIEFDPVRGTVIFAPDATLSMQAHEDGLECRLDASDEAQLGALKGTVAHQLDRYAFCESPLRFDWQDQA